MHVNECNWIIDKLDKFNRSEISPILDFGASTLEYRTLQQPWLEKNLYKKLEDRRINILFADLKNTEGVDLVGDIFDMETMQFHSRKDDADGKTWKNNF